LNGYNELGVSGSATDPSLLNWVYERKVEALLAFGTLRGNFAVPLQLQFNDLCSVFEVHFKEELLGIGAFDFLSFDGLVTLAFLCDRRPNFRR
jgi:hypothetical protein